MSRFDWMDDAACADHNPDTWFPSVTGHGGTRQVADAAAVCARCPVARQCAELSGGAAYGVWAGTPKRVKGQGVSGGGPRKTRTVA
jgi:WhiB family transcriptional regulator, redox-sensing transcriptional regulator